MHRRYVRYAYVLPIPNEIRLGLQNLRHAPSTTSLCEKFSRALIFRFFSVFFPIFLMCMNHFSDILRMPSKILCVAILFFYKCNTFFIQHTIFPLPRVGKKGLLHFDIFEIDGSLHALITATTIPMLDRIFVC